MIQSIEGMIREMEQEAAATKRLLELVPADKLEWRPHERSMSLGQLSLHVASIPGSVTKLMQADTLDTSEISMQPRAPESKDELLTALEDGLAHARQVLSGLDEDAAKAHWKLKKGDKELFSLPRIGMARTILLNHWYHHRGQLTVYLRLLNIPLPVTYGRSADNNPFA